MDKKEWFRARKWGVFHHYLNALQNQADSANSDGQQTDWNDCVNALNTDWLAEQLHEMGAGYLVFTIMQRSRHMIAPNAAYDAITGYKPGEACSERDLIADLIASLSKYDIPLFLYYTGDGPGLDGRAARAFGCPTEIPGASVDAFLDKWLAVLREYSLRYGEKIRGWWIDGAYPPCGFPTPDAPGIGRIREAALAGNPNALFSANHFGCFHGGGTRVLPEVGEVIFGNFYHSIAQPTAYDDYSAGEIVSFDAYPEEREIGGVIPHVLSFLGIPAQPVKVYEGWGKPGCKYSPEYLRAYVDCFNQLGGVVSLDACLHRDGTIDSAQRKALAALRSRREREGGQ